MLNGLPILIIGGDARYLEVLKKLAEDGANVVLVGFDQLSFDYPNVRHSKMNNIDFSEIDVIILPVAGTNAEGKVETTFSDSDIFLSKEMIAQTPKHCIIYTGISNSFLDHAAESTNREIVRLFARDDIAISNSIPTAEGAVRLVIEQTDITIHGARVMVLGFGRVGFTVSRLFSSIGANVSVAVRKSSDVARIKEMGMKPILLEKLAEEITDSDICINTIPHPILDAAIISKMAKSTLIIDLASKPGGTDFAFAEKQGMKALHALGLPGKIAPKSAGGIIAGVLGALLK